MSCVKIPEIRAAITAESWYNVTGPNKFSVCSVIYNHDDY